MGEKQYWIVFSSTLPGVDLCQALGDEKAKALEPGLNRVWG
jgi:hypothetical protein